MTTADPPRPSADEFSATTGALFFRVCRPPHDRPPPLTYLLLLLLVVLLSTCRYVPPLAEGSATWERTRKRAIRSRGRWRCGTDVGLSRAQQTEYRCSLGRECERSFRLLTRSRQSSAAVRVSKLSPLLTMFRSRHSSCRSSHRSSHRSARHSNSSTWSGCGVFGLSRRRHLRAGCTERHRCASHLSGKSSSF